MTEQAEVTVIFGQRGSGKTTKARHLVRDKRRVLVYDTLGHDYADGVVCSDRDTFERFWLRTYRGNFRLVYRPADPIAEFERVCQLAYECGNLAFVVEEVDLFFRGGLCCSSFTNIIARGRHEAIELYAVTQCPKGFGSLLRAQAHNWYIFATREPAHVDYFTSRCPGLVAAQIQALQKYEYLRYTDGQDTYERCQDDPGTGRTHGRQMPLERPGTPDDPGLLQHAPAPRNV